MMKGYYDNEGYYRKLIELQEKLRRSEEERMKLEEKFNKMIQHKREEEQLELHRLKRQYNKFLEEEKFRSDRNDQIVRALDRIEYKAGMLTAKTDRLRILRGQCESCIKRSLTWNYNNNNNNIKPIVQQSTRDMSYLDNQQSRPTSLSIGNTNPFQSKFIYSSPSQGGASNSAQYYPNMDQSNEQNINKPTSMSYFNKQNTTTDFVTPNFDNNYGSKISSRFTAPAVQENSTINRGNLPIRNPLNHFNENGFPQFDRGIITNENPNTSYPSIYNAKNDRTHQTYQMQKAHLRPEINDPHRDTWSKHDDQQNMRKESPSQNLINKENFISTIPNPEKLSQEYEPKHGDLNTGNINPPQPSNHDGDTKIKHDTGNKIKPTNCYIVDEEYNNAEDVRILNNAQDGYYVEDEREQIYENPQQQKGLEKPSKRTDLPSSNFGKEIQDKNQPKSLNANQTSNIENHDIYKNSDPQKVKDIINEQPLSNEIIAQNETPTEATENAKNNVVKLANENNLPTDANDGISLAGQEYRKPIPSKTPENYTESFAESPKSNQQVSESNVDQIQANNYEPENNSVEQQIMNEEGTFEQMQANNYETEDVNYETNYDPETTNQTQEGYENYNQSENVVNPDETQIQEGYDNYNQSENYEPILNSDTAQLQEGYANYEPSENPDSTQLQEGTSQLQEGFANYEPSENPDSAQLQEGYADYESAENPETAQLQEDYENYEPDVNPDTTQLQEGYESYEPDVNINQIPEVYGNYDESQGVIAQDTTLQYEGYDNTQQQIDPHNAEGYDNSQEQYDPNNAEGYDISQDQYDPNNIVYDETNQMSSNMEPSQMYNEDSVVGDDPSAVQYTDDNQMYYAENQEYLQDGQEYQQDVGAYDPNVPQDNGDYQSGQIPQDGAYQEDGSGYPVGNIPQESVYQEEAYQDNMYAEEGQMDYTAELNNIQGQEIMQEENYDMTGSNQPQMGLQNDTSVEKLTSNLSTLLDSDTSEQQSSDQQQVPSVKDESDFDFSESAAT